MARFTSVIALLLLTGCPDDTVIVDPPVPSSGIQLIDGAYELRVLDITSIECEGVRGRDVIGQSLYGSLQTAGTDATFTFEGMELTGSHSGGWLSVSGSISSDEDPGCYETQDDDSDSSTSNDPKGGGTGCVDHEQPERAAYSVSIDAQVHSVRSAMADLAIDVEGCAISVVVSMAWGPGDGDSVVDDVEPEPRETKDDEAVGEEPSDDGAEDGE